MKVFYGVVSGLILLGLSARASSVLPLSLDEHVRIADAVFRGTVLKNESFRNSDGSISTRTFLRVDEGFKGRLPLVVKLIHRGGEINGVGQIVDLSPRFQAGQERLLFVHRQSNGSLSVVQGDASAVILQRDASHHLALTHQNLLNTLRSRTGPGSPAGADVTDQSGPVDLNSITAPSGDNSGSSTNGLLTDNSGIPYRYPICDSGDTIPYLVDTNSLPTGITPAQALNAVSNALSVWAAASSFKFVFTGTKNFGQASPSINTNDGIFRIQLHDDTNYITSPNVLGVGGSYFSVGLLAGANWGPGGKVSGMEFNKGQAGFVILKHTHPAMQDLQTFTEVLTHEVGHVIGLAHSSNITTNDPVLTNSIMYFTAHADGRGAHLNSYDTNVIREIHPLDTPPFSYNRFLDITTASTAPNVAGINQLQLRGYDLQTTNLTFQTTNGTANNGSFSVAGNVLSFTPGFVGGSRLDPAGNTFYDAIYARFSDASSFSAYVSVHVISLNPDFVAPSDGIPDAWMTSYFGHTDPKSSDKSRAADDKDGDGLSNLQEYIAGMTPTNAASAQRITFVSTNKIQWQAKPYELYEVLGNTNLANTNGWARLGNPVIPTDTNTSLGTFTNFFNAAVPSQFIRILKVP